MTAVLPSGGVHAVDRGARRLAYATVGLPAAGFAAALWRAAHTGFTGFDVLVLVAMYAVTALGVEGGLHRLFSHRSYTAAGPLTVALAIAGSMAAQGPVVFWVATHRMHHAHTDREGDPHSPLPIGDGRTASLRGLWHGHVGWLFTVSRSGWAKHAKDLLADRRMLRIDRLYFLWVGLGLALPAGAGLLANGPAGALDGMLWGGLARIFLLDQATWSVNSIGHLRGARRYPTRDNSRNVASLAVVSVGGSWHNNHHAMPGSAFNRHVWWQLDLTGAVLRVLMLLHLVRDAQRPRTTAARRDAP